MRFFNYLYQAIEETLVNAVYHRGYDVRKPVEVRIMVQESQNLRQMQQYQSQQAGSQKPNNNQTYKGVAENPKQEQ